MNGLLRVLFLLGCLGALTACRSSSEIRNPAAKPNLRAAAYNVQLGMKYLEKGRVHRAKHKLLLAMKQGPRYIPAVEAMAMYYDRTGQGQRAKKYYQRAIELDPHSGRAQNNYGGFLCRNGDHARSIEHFIKAVDDPNYLTTAEAYENAGLCAMLIPNEQMAQTFFKKAIAIKPDSSSALLELSQISYDKKDYVTARGYLKMYNHFAKESAQSLYLAALIYDKLGHPNLAASKGMLLTGKYPQSAWSKKYKGQIAS